jgi:hypothetical protein
VERGAQVDRDDRVPFVFGEFGDRRDMLDTRVVHEDVDPAERPSARRDEIADLRGLRHVGPVVRGLHAELLELAALLLDRAASPSR